MRNAARQAETAHVAGESVRRFAAQLKEAQYGGPGPFNQTRPNSDPQSQTSASLHSFNVTARIVMGQITDTTAIGNVYRVQLEKAKAPVVAIFAPRTSIGTFGARELTTLQPGTVVSCLVHEQMAVAQIIATYPPPGAAANQAMHAILHGATRARVDEGHKQPFRMVNNGGIPASLAGRPYDATTCGEAGWITETGMRVFLDSFMALVGLDESCQISVHYHDMLCRIAGYQLQIWTSVKEHTSYNDQDESQDWTGYAMYPWEQLGLAARTDPARLLSALEWQIKQPHYSNMEPRDNFMMPWHREREFHGYLGQGGKRCVIAPPIEFTTSGDLGTSTAPPAELPPTAGSAAEFTSFMGGTGTTAARHPGQADFGITADGRMLFQSAKGIHLVKRAAIMLPTRLKQPEEPDGDNPQNYKFSGLLGDGPEHTITGDIATQGENTAFNRAMGILDMHAYFFNYAGIHPFYYHAEDYRVYEEREASWSGGVSEQIPNYGKLASETYIDAEDYRRTWQIDHRYGEQQFYTLSCGFELLDDGGVMISDGFGGTIRMTGGSVEISAPGDVWLRSGRNTNVWAGRDAVVRAKNAWDITATEGDGRLKADRNLMMLSGNSGTGGTLIESRGTGAFNFDKPGEAATLAGVVIRSPEAPVIAWSNSVYLRTGGPGISDGPIVLDAGRAASDVVIYANTQRNFLTQGEFWHLNATPEGSGEGPAAMISGSGCVLPSGLQVDGGLIANGNVIAGGGVASTSGFVAVTSPFVGELQGDSLRTVLDALTQTRETTRTTLPQVGTTVFSGVLQAQFYDTGRPGNNDIIQQSEFSLRTTEDYGTAAFKLYEDRWQQLGRLSQQPATRWVENPVLSRGQETYPYPGAAAFRDQAETFGRQDLTLFNAEAGRSRDRGVQPNLADIYKTPEFAEPVFTSLNDYTVIR